MPSEPALRRLRVFVASPADVAAERKRVDTVLARMNPALESASEIRLDPWRYEVDAIPGLGVPQELINPDLDQADIVVAILWNSLGTPGAGGRTGTEEEILRAIERRPAHG